MFRKSASLIIVLLCCIAAQQGVALAKKAKRKAHVAVPIHVVPTDPLRVESTSSPAIVPQSSFAMVPDLSCAAGKMKVDFKAPNFSFAAYIASQQSTASEALP